MKKINFLAASAILAFAAVSTSFAQNNLGADCGCPSVSSRAVVEMNTIFTGTTTGGITLDHDAVLTCDKIYVMRTKCYVINGATLTVMPGTVVKGAATGVATDASALIITKGSKIIADGTQTCPIVFTAESDNLSTHPICSRGEWGGLVLLGKAKNNLIVGNAYCTGTAGVGFVEGYNGTLTYNQYGMPAGQTDDDDNSGILRYVSIRHSGAVLQLANELNGLSLGSVGRGTTIDYLDIIGSDDDGIEFFGGTVNVKHIAMYWGNDDMFDYDLGWKGKAQFLFGIQSPDVASIPGGDNGFEADGDDDKKGDAAGYMSHPIIYNATLIGNGLGSANDFTGPSAIRAKERTEGEIYNSVFANFKFGLDISRTRGSLGAPSGSADAYENWNAGTLVVKNNTFVNMTDATYGPNGICISTTNGKGTGTPAVRAVASASDITKFQTTDGNTYQTTALPGFDYTFGLTCGTPGSITDKFDAVPNPEIAGVLPPAGTGFTPVSYRGAFGASEKNWLSDWSIGSTLGVSAGLTNCPTDVNLDGKTDGSDYLQLLQKIFTSCQ
jgi:hypothetical protein